MSGPIGQVSGTVIQFLKNTPWSPACVPSLSGFVYNGFRIIMSPCQFKPPPCFTRLFRPAEERFLLAVLMETGQTSIAAAFASGASDQDGPFRCSTRGEAC